MTDYDLMSVIMDLHEFLPEKQLKFCRDVAGLMARGKTLSLAQHQYLVSCYNLVVERKYGLESMASDREYAERRAISKNRKPQL